MNELLIINGVSYDISSSKIPYVIDTQFNYFKFPPRIKSLPVDDTINLDDVLEDIDIVSARYIIGEDVGIPARDGSTKIIYRAGEYDSSNLVDYFSNPGGNPAGYKMYFPDDNILRYPIGAWVKPAILDINMPINGNELIKPSKFVITPDMIAAGENIFFNIRVTMRVDSSDAWIERSLSINPLEEPAPLPYSYSPINRRVALYVEGRKEAQAAQDAADAALGISTSFLGSSTSLYVTRPRFAEFDALRIPPADPNIVSLNITNTALIELKLNRADDVPGGNSILNKVSYAGTFWDGEKTSNDVVGLGLSIIGQSEEDLILKYINDIKVLDTNYRSLLVEYNIMQSSLSDRSTSTERAVLDNLKIKADNALIELEKAQSDLKAAQQKLKKLRSDVITSSTVYDTNLVNRLFPVNNNINEMGYQIRYMVDIKTAKAYDEYYITTACGNPYNLIYKDNTYWDIVPQSKLDTVFK